MRSVAVSSPLPNDRIPAARVEAVSDADKVAPGAVPLFRDHASVIGIVHGVQDEVHAQVGQRTSDRDETPAAKLAVTISSRFG